PILPPPPRPPLSPYTTLFRADPAPPNAGRVRLPRTLAPPLVPSLPPPRTRAARRGPARRRWTTRGSRRTGRRRRVADGSTGVQRSEEHTSELQSRGHLVCRLL